MFIKAWLSLLVDSANANSYLPVQASTFAGDVDAVYNFMLWVSIFFFVVLMGGMTIFVVKYKRKTHTDKTPHITHNYFLEFLWSFIPLVLLLGVFYWGWVVYHKMRTFPDNAIEVQVVGKQWLWEMHYKNGKKVTNDMVVPVDTPVVLNITASDVLHSFFVPSFRIKQDAVPGRMSKLWFEANAVGNYRIFCTEFCGTAHSQMIGSVKVIPQDEYQKWLETDDSAGMSLAQKGETLYKNKGCNACHTTDGEARVGPSFKGLFDSPRSFVGGGNIDKADANYIVESILNPQAKVVQGYQGVIMPPFQGQITEEEIGFIIEYIKSL
ncbi:MAG: cytochrome c oxidase subunit II [Bdellovibrionales bacterium CG10_big_fil_rev_8_21_14_0_10_45_34]|nr:MAG: cytochrome c oxidase subunit II [Bdellovibrionales bacterium CG10_big_fil_rev_8_21_14_0_10_45_34]